MTCSTRGGAMVIFGVILGLAALSGALAQPPPTPAEVCSWLTMYGNSVADRLCKTVSMHANLNQGQLVCELTNPGGVDMHTTFNYQTRLHLTVRKHQLGQDGNSYLAGVWLGQPPAGPPVPPGVARVAGQPAQVLGVDVDNYVARLNSQTRRAGASHLMRCRAGFDAALGALRISQATKHFYYQQCQLRCGGL